MLGALESRDLQLQIVWLPMLKKDSARRAERVARRMRSDRIRHYWSPTRAIGEAFRERLPPLKEAALIAWDVYLLYGKKERWEGEIPEPELWMHQLGRLGADHPLFLDGDLLTRKTGELLLGEPKELAVIPTADLRAGDDPKKRYLLHGPKEGASPPTPGYGLLVVLPGGPGDAGFRVFVKRIYANALEKDWLVAQPVAVRWREDQSTIWPCRKLRANGMKFTTEEFVEAVIADVARRRKIDPRRVTVLAWSSSGPAAYSLSMDRKRTPTGFLLAMSVFRREWLPDLRGARDQAYYLYHSPEDRTCDFRQAEQARDQLARVGARTKLVTYPGGHGWRGDSFAAIRRGIEWLDANRARRR